MALEVIVKTNEIALACLGEKDVFEFDNNIYVKIRDILVNDYSVNALNLLTFDFYYISPEEQVVLKKGILTIE